MILRPTSRRLAAAFAILAGLAAARAQAAPRVVASVRPVQSLVAGVMAGIGEPGTIVHGAGSPHTYAIRPSEARALNAADLVFWIGPDYESFLIKPVAGLGGRTRVVALIRAPGIELLAARQGGAWEAGRHEAEPAGRTDLQDTDPHIFLDPANAQAMVRAIAAALDEADPANRARYDANAQAVIARLAALDRELAAALAPVRAVPYVVFHDGYQYLERRYGLSAVGSVVVSPDRPPGARRLAEIHRKIETLHAACVFAEPQFDSALVRTVIEGTRTRVGTLDYVGVDLKPGPDAYFEMMRGLARGLAGCLAG